MPCRQAPPIPALLLPAAPGASSRQVRRSDVQSAWSGIRPLALDPNATGTQELLLVAVCSCPFHGSHWTIRAALPCAALLLPCSSCLWLPHTAPHAAPKLRAPVGRPADTASASRDHIVTVDPDGLITVTGGWVGGWVGSHWLSDSVTAAHSLLCCEIAPLPLLTAARCSCSHRHGCPPPPARRRQVDDVPADGSGCH